MAYGIWTDPQRKVIAQYMIGQEVLDLGAGDLHWAREAISLGARHVIAVDKEAVLAAGPHIDAFRGTFLSYVKKEPIRRFEVGLLSWPVNHTMLGLLDLIQRCDRVIYVGSNMYGNACGWPRMFSHLSQRTLEAYVPWRRNNLLVYGPELRHSRPIVGEEYAGMFNDDVLTNEMADARAAAWTGSSP